MIFFLFLLPRLFDEFSLVDLETLYEPSQRSMLLFQRKHEGFRLSKTSIFAYERPKGVRGRESDTANHLILNDDPAPL